MHISKLSSILSVLLSFPLHLHALQSPFDARSNSSTTTTVMITFYDLAAKGGIKTWAPNTWRVRYVLNYKKLLYKTVALEFADIESTFKELGIPPSGTKPDGTGLYSSPSIIDESPALNEPPTPTTRVTDSYKIAEYLDRAYPSTPPVFPPGSEALQAAFYDHVSQLIDPLWPLLLPKFPVNVLNPRSAEYFTSTRSMYLGKPLADLEPQGAAREEAWMKVQEAFDTFNKWLGKSNGRFFMGQTITFSDFVIAGILDGIRVCFGEESEEWKNVQAWNGGRWEDYLAELKQFASVEN